VVSGRWQAERIVCIVGMITGGFVFSAMMASMFAVLNPDSSSRVQQEKMDVVGAYIRLHKIPHKLASRVLAFYRRQVTLLRFSSTCRCA
jgi:hypothetical protein